MNTTNKKKHIFCLSTLRQRRFLFFRWSQVQKTAFWSAGVHTYSFHSTKDMEMISSKVKKPFPSWEKIGQFPPQPPGKIKYWNFRQFPARFISFLISGPFDSISNTLANSAVQSSTPTLIQCYFFTDTPTRHHILPNWDAIFDNTC